MVTTKKSSIVGKVIIYALLILLAFTMIPVDILRKVIVGRK